MDNNSTTHVFNNTILQSNKSERSRKKQHFVIDEIHIEELIYYNQDTLNNYDILDIANDLGYIPLNLYQVGARSDALPQQYHQEFKRSSALIDTNGSSSSSSSSSRPIIGMLYDLNKNNKILGRYNKEYLPFPTLFWMTSKRLKTIISKLEDLGYIDKFQKRLNESDEAKLMMIEAHKEYAHERYSILKDIDKEYIESKGWTSSLKDVGIAGIHDFSTVKCLHCHYAHYLSRPNSKNINIIGYWVHEVLQQQQRQQKQTNQNNI